MSKWFEDPTCLQYLKGASKIAFWSAEINTLGDERYLSIGIFRTEGGRVFVAEHRTSFPGRVPSSWQALYLDGISDPTEPHEAAASILRRYDNLPAEIQTALRDISKGESIKWEATPEGHISGKLPDGAGCLWVLDTDGHYELSTEDSDHWPPTGDYEWPEPPNSVEAEARELAEDK